TSLLPVHVVQAVRRATRRPWVLRNRRCLREGLLAYRLLAEMGFRPKLHFGVEPDVMGPKRVAAHCWVTVDGRTILGEVDTPYIEIFVHPAPAIA
ncbi:lasso peptide biosynthesis B2 protein, partial [Shinella sp.]|uniref:lasso peptide biosynthesis B2 protein n=1 Tax=Shinella sp. TaxID=1870904 RepID=UPI003F6FF94C